MQNAPHIVILAAGRGTRMRSSIPKVLQTALFRPMLHHVLDLARALPHRSISVIVGHGEALVRQSCAGLEANFFTQEPQLGTAHALRQAEPFLASQEGDVLVLSGDVILLRQQTVWDLLKKHAESRASCTVGTTRVAQPHGYGRIVRQGERIVDIREEKDCSPAERAITEVNGGVYCFAIRPLLEALAQIGNRNAQGEYYLPDAVRLIAAKGSTVADSPIEDPEELLGVNDFAALAQAEAVLRRRVNRELMLQGVRLLEPETTVIDQRCRFGREVVIEGGCTLVASELGNGVVVERGSRVARSRVADHAEIRQGSYVHDSEIGARTSVGPYAQLRPGTRLAEDVRVGNFVEIKNSTLAPGVKAGHLSYIGDAEIGRDVNVGCGFITCNYDGGPKKLRTVIGDDVFIGSDVQCVAPISVGAGSFIAAGSTVTESVPEDSLVLGRSRQTTKAGYADELRKRRGIKPRPARAE
jgi:bifunctional UDP-N-acetylglucosamine pyrophosphorylase/glucosamine-1-phosphate N-acetyltransferase